MSEDAFERAHRQGLACFLGVGGAVLAHQVGLPVLATCLTGAALAEAGEVASTVIRDGEHDGMVGGRRVELVCNR